MDVYDFADLMIGFGAHKAILLDGSGSSVLCAEWDTDDMIVSSPSDPGNTERPDAVNFGVRSINLN